MAVNYNDSRFQEVEKEKNQAINQTESTYNEIVNKSDSYYQQQIDASKDWANKQSELQQSQTDFAIEKVEQAKDKAQKDYVKEQKAAYTDYQKAIDPYGANAETLASQGLQNSGYSESTRTNMYNTYQNRYMSARESYNQAILNYDNSIKEAQLANSSVLAQIAAEALQKQLELSLQGFQYKNQLVLQKLNAVNAEKDRYYQRYQDVLSQINTENALAEQIRQYNENLALEKQQLAEEQRQYNESLAFQKQQAAQEQSNWEKEYALSKSSKLSSSSSGSLSNSNDSSKSNSGNSKVSGGGSSGETAKITNSSTSSASTPQAPIVKVNGTAYYQDAAVAIKETGYTTYSTTKALNEGIITSKIVNGAIYYAPAKKAPTTSSGYNRTVKPSAIESLFG